jgi:hypothetical protein
MTPAYLLHRPPFRDGESRTISQGPCVYPHPVAWSGPERPFGGMAPDAAGEYTQVLESYKAG